MSTVATPQTTRKFGAGSIVAIAIGLGVVGLIGVKVKDKVAQKNALEASSQATAEQAKAQMQGQAQMHGQAQTPQAPAPGKELVAKARGTSFVKPTPMTWQPRVAVTGTLEPIQRADVGFKVGGRLGSIKVKLGEVVKTGQALAFLDTSEAAAQASAAGAGLRAAEISLEMAQDSQKRTDTLFQQNAIAEAEKTNVGQRAMLAQAQVEQARAQQRLAAVTLGNATLAAPFGGLVTQAPTGIGKIVTPGEALFHIEDTSVLKLSATVGESDAKLVAIGAAVSIENAPEARGKITAVVGALDPQTRRVPVVAEIPNGPEVGLLSGAFVRAEIVGAKAIPVLKVPAAALRQGSQDELVVAKDGKAHLVRVVFSTEPDGSLLVRRGLEASDEVVLSPSLEVREGDTLAPAAAPSPTATP
jgi:RND family efflux transporter MFP subunit